MSKDKFNINKKYLILAIVCVFIVIAYCVFCKTYFKKGNSDNTYLVNQQKNDIYEITATKIIKINGKSEFTDERSIFYDSTLGEVRDLKIQDKQAIQQGQVLFTYYNKSVEKQISKIKQQIELNNNKVTRNNSQKENYVSNINEINTSINIVKANINEITTTSNVENNNENLTENIETTVDSINMDVKKTELENKIIQLESEIAAYESKIELINSENEALAENNDSLNVDIKFLESDLSTDIIGEISGTAHINEGGKTDLTTPYIKIYSEDTVIKGEISEYDKGQIGLEKEVLIKTINNNEYKKGKITEINEIPNQESNDGVSMYNFYVTLDDSVENGFSAEVIINYDSIEIPEKYVFEDNSRYFVAKANNGSYERVEIIALKNSEAGKFYLLNAALVEGDEIIANPSSLF